MEKSNKSFIKVFSEMDNQTNTLNGIVSMMYALEDAMIYGKSNLKEYTGAVSLINDLIYKFNETNKELICEGYEILKAEKEKQLQVAK